MNSKHEQPGGQNQLPAPEAELRLKIQRKENIIQLYNLAIEYMKLELAVDTSFIPFENQKLEEDFEQNDTLEIMRVLGNFEDTNEVQEWLYGSDLNNGTHSPRNFEDANIQARLTELRKLRNRHLQQLAKLEGDLLDITEPIEISSQTEEPRSGVDLLIQPSARQAEETEESFLNSAHEHFWFKLILRYEANPDDFPAIQKYIQDKFGAPNSTRSD
jgi:hypothetical protein